MQKRQAVRGSNGPALHYDHRGDLLVPVHFVKSHDVVRFHSVVSRTNSVTDVHPMKLLKCAVERHKFSLNNRMQSGHPAANLSWALLRQSEFPAS
jgi:hypothetical protein